MPVLVPSFLPPPPASTPIATSTVLANSKQALNGQPSSTSALPSPMPTSSQPQPLAQPTCGSTTAENDTLEASVPTVTLSQSIIEPELAAALASSMLGHILFLKGQIPMYVPSTPIIHILGALLTRILSCSVQACSTARTPPSTAQRHESEETHGVADRARYA